MLPTSIELARGRGVRPGVAARRQRGRAKDAPTERMGPFVGPLFAAAPAAKRLWVPSDTLGCLMSECCVHTHQTFLRLDFPLKEKQSPPKFERHWDESVFPSLPVQQYEEIVEIDVLPTKAQRLINPTARVSEESDESREPMTSHFLWFPTEKELQLRCRVRRQDDLRLFHLRNLERGASPFQIGIDGADGTVAACRSQALLPHADDYLLQFVFGGQL